MGASGSHLSLLPSFPGKQRRAAISQAFSRKFEKRKKISRTLKKIIHHNSKHANKDQCKAFRTFLLSWSTIELSRLVEVYESTIVLHQVAMEASSAKMAAPHLALDLARIHMRQLCCDLILQYQESVFYVHKAILASRSNLFKKLVANKCPEDILLVPEMSNITVDMFRDILLFIYSDCEAELTVLTKSKIEGVKSQFGIQKSILQSLTHLHDAGDYHDLILTFVRTPQNQSGYPGLPETVRLAKLPCHSSVLASRSELLCSMILKAKRNHHNHKSPCELVLDDSVINHKYGLLLLKVIYQDQFDLNWVSSHVNSASSSLTEAQAIVAGRSNLTMLEEAYELHHIGNLLELHILTDKCEEFIVQSLSPENLSAVLTWSQQPSGASWVYRETLQYIQDNFMQISKSPALFGLDQTTLAKVLQSDFLQASETDILQAVINWSEHQLIKRLERREPNLVTHTAHSLARKGVKSKDLDSSELRDIASLLLTHVRQPHLLPSDSEIVTNAIKRGLIGSSISNRSFDLAASEPHLLNHGLFNQQDSWIPSAKSLSTYIVPRAYMPFYEVARNLLEERTKDMSESDVIHLRRPSRPYGQRANSLPYNLQIRHSTMQNMTRHSPEDEMHMVFTDETVDEVIQRTEELLQTPIVLQALQACSDKTAVLKQVCLWAARELGCPEHIIYTVKAKTNLTQSAEASRYKERMSNSIVPDLAPERLLLQHGVSESCENLTVHSVNSSPDVTLLSMKSYKRDTPGARCYPDVTQHSHSPSGSETSLKGGACALSRSRSSLHRRRKPSRYLSAVQADSNDLPELLSQHLRVDNHTIIVTQSSIDLLPKPPDVLADSPPNLSLTLQEPDLMASSVELSPRQVATLDSRPYRHARQHRSQSASLNPYHTPPRGSFQSNRQQSSLLYSSLTRNMATANHPSAATGTLERPGPPPDLAPRPPRRLTGTSTPPDVTSSPNNTWQALL